MSGEELFATSNVGFVVSCVIGVVVMTAALSRPRPVWLAAALVLLGLKGLAMVALGLSVPFGVAHALWLDLVVVLPTSGALAFLLTRRRVLLLALLVVPVGVYASLVEPERLVTERATVRVAPERAGDGEVRIGVLADLQFERVGDHEREAVERVLRERPDLIVLPGDFHQGTAESFERELPAIRGLMRRLRAPLGVYAVQGDAESVVQLRRVFEDTGVVVLVNRRARLRTADRRVVVAGVERTSPRTAEAVANAFAREPGSRDVRILLTHRPDVALALPPDSRIDLVVAGHTHGGQVQIPFLGPPFTASEVPRDVAAGGLHEMGGTTIYVSRGIGVERNQAPKLRFGAVPEVSILTLRG